MLYNDKKKHSLGSQILGFGNIEELYEHDKSFAFTYVSCLKKSFDQFYIYDDYLCKRKNFVYFKDPLESFLSKKVTGGGGGC